MFYLIGAYQQTRPGIKAVDICGGEACFPACWTCEGQAS